MLRSTSIEGVSEFSADLAEWLSPPRKPEFKPSKRTRASYRNALAFGAVCLVVFTVVCIAFTGGLPGPIYLGISLATSLALAVRTWWVERKLAMDENAVRFQSHKERYRAYLRRKKVWSRLRHCTRCGSVVDPVTGRSATLYEMHELVNKRA